MAPTLNTTFQVHAALVKWQKHRIAAYAQITTRAKRGATGNQWRSTWLTIRASSLHASAHWCIEAEPRDWKQRRRKWTRSGCMKHWLTIRSARSNSRRGPAPIGRQCSNGWGGRCCAAMFSMTRRGSNIGSANHRHRQWAASRDFVLCLLLSWSHRSIPDPLPDDAACDGSNCFARRLHSTSTTREIQATASFPTLSSVARLPPRTPAGFACERIRH